MAVEAKIDIRVLLSDRRRALGIAFHTLCPPFVCMCPRVFSTRFTSIVLPPCLPERSPVVVTAASTHGRRRGSC